MRPLDDPKAESELVFLTAIGLAEFAICQGARNLINRFFTGDEGHHSQALQRFQLEIQIGCASATKPVMHRLSLRPFIERSFGRVTRGNRDRHDLKLVEASLGKGVQGSTAIRIYAMS